MSIIQINPFSYSSRTAFLTNASLLLDWFVGNYCWFLPGCDAKHNRIERFIFLSQPLAVDEVSVFMDRSKLSVCPAPSNNKPAHWVHLFCTPIRQSFSLWEMSTCVCFKPAHVVGDMCLRRMIISVRWELLVVYSVFHRVCMNSLQKNISSALVRVSQCG